MPRQAQSSLRTQACRAKPSPLPRPFPHSETITMSRSRLLGLLACSLLLLTVHDAAADPTRSALQNPIIQNTCPVTVKVGKEFDQALVPLQRTHEFFLKPSHSEMSVRILGDDSLYKASVDGTMITLFGCDEFETNCTLLDHGGSKSSDLLTVNKWNRVQVNYINGQITVDINSISNVMGKITMTKTQDPDNSKDGAGGGDDFYITFVVPPLNPAYFAKLNISCDENGRPPKVVTVTPVTPTPPITTPPHTTTSPMNNRPFPNCPPYRVEADHPTPTSGEPILESLTFAVYPSHPFLQMDIFSDKLYIKTWISGQTMMIQKCNKMGRSCINENQARDSGNILVPEVWNNVTLFLEDDKFIITTSTDVRASVVLEPGAHKNLRVVVSAPQNIANETNGHFVALVNVQCVGIEESTIHPGTASTKTQAGLPTKDSIVETTTAAPSGVSRDVGIVVGVLACVLLIIVVAIIITYRKRRSATLNEHSPLKNQHQQQD